MLRHLSIVILLGIPSALSGQPEASQRAIVFPDVPGYHTLKVDLHMHTVFSDGSVWPDVRVLEAIRDRLDAIAITDHIEWLPHKDDIPPVNRNRSFEIARDLAERLDSDLIVIRGSEITRNLPPGHANAVFLQDANPMVNDDWMESYREAARQGAFTFWNHPAWVGQQPDGVAELTDIHRNLIDEGLLQGIEVVNMHDYSDEALQIALDHNLTMIGTSDIHMLVAWEFEDHHRGHRPITLVFATERSAAGIHEGLRAGRTVVWFRNLLIGKEEHVVPLIEASLAVVSATYDRDRSVLAVELENRSDVTFMLRNDGPYSLHRRADLAPVAPHATTTLHVRTLEQLPRVELHFTVLNAVTAPQHHPAITLDVPVN